MCDGDGDGDGDCDVMCTVNESNSIISNRIESYNTIQSSYNILHLSYLLLFIYFLHFHSFQ